ncbi:hypothetical protein [Corynebacterium tapiri]|nr:hypothetical protein [Corynebacterium tapiri]
MQSSLANSFDPQIWDPIIIAITNIAGPIHQVLSPVYALGLMSSGLL